MTNVPMTLPDLMLAEHGTTFFHSSTFVELDDSRILHAAGTGQCTSEDGGLTWSDVIHAKDTNGDPVGGGNTCLVKLSDRGIGLAAAAPRPDKLAPAQRRAHGHQLFWRSPDRGQTWEPPVQITSPGIVGTGSYQDAMIRTHSGRIVLPMHMGMGQGSGPNDVKPWGNGKLVRNQWVSTAGHFSDPHFYCVFVAFSDDDGRTWQYNQDGHLMILRDWSTHYSYVVEPTVTEVKPGRLLMFMRTGLGRHFQAWSNDNGETWTRPQPTSLAASTTPAQIGTLPNGHLVCVWNQESSEEIRRGYNRTRLSSAISRNGGSVWEFFQNVESLHESTRVEPGPIEAVHPEEIHFDPGQPAPVRNGEYVVGAEVHGRWSYPSMIVLKDRVIIAHTYSAYDDHPTSGQLVRSHAEPGSVNQKQKVLPLRWFYGGKEPASNPFLKEAYEPAKP